jgi:WD40 repeat protein
MKGNMKSSELPKQVAGNIDRFTGRKWLLPKLLDWWDGSDERLFLLTGGPGTGKSMILAWLAGFGPAPADLVAHEQWARVRLAFKAAHFCQASTRNITPQAFAESIANQLTDTVKGFGDALAATLADRVQIVGTAQAGTAAPGANLTGVAIRQIDLGTLGDELSFDRAFTQPLKELYARDYSEPMLLLVDALDEAQTYSGVILSDLLSRVADLPEPVRILASTRDDPRVLKFFRAIKPFDLIKHADPNVDDVQTYAEGRLAALSAVEDAKRQDFAQRLATQASGVFLYAAIVLEELLERPPSELPDLDTYPLPKGLSGLYKGFLTRELGKNDPHWFDLYEPLLGLIAVAQGDGLTTEQLTNLVGKDIRAALRASKQYLTGELPDGPFHPFHKSFADFLLEDADNPDYHIDARSMHKRIADYFWSVYRGDESMARQHPKCLVPDQRHSKDRNWLDADTYVRSHLASHSAFAANLDRLVNDPLFLIAAEPAGLLMALARSPPDNAALDAVRTYVSAVHHRKSNDIGDWASFLELVARRDGADSFAEQISRLPLRRKWRPRWAHCRVAASNRLIDGYTHPITAVNFGVAEGSPVLVAGSDNGVIRAWDPRTGVLVKTFAVLDSAPISAVAIANDAPALIAGDKAGMVSVWDLRTGLQCLDPFRAHSGAIRELNVVMVTGGALIVSVGVDEKLVILDVNTGCAIAGPLSEQVVCASAIGELEGRSVLALTKDGESISLWDIENQELMRSLYDPFILSPIDSMVFGTSDIIAKEGGNLQLRDIEDGQKIGPATDAGSYSSPFASLEIGRKEMLLATVTGEFVRIWREGGIIAPLVALSGNNGEINAIALGEIEGQPFAASGAEDGTVRIWNLSEFIGASGANKNLHYNRVNSMSVGTMPDRRQVVAAQIDYDEPTTRVLPFEPNRGIRGWDLASGEEFCDIRGQMSHNATALTAGGLCDRPLLVFEGNEESIWYHDIANGENRKLGRALSRIAAIDICEWSGQTVIVSVDREGVLDVYDGATKVLIHSVILPFDESWENDEPSFFFPKRYTDKAVISASRYCPIVIAGGNDPRVRAWEVTGAHLLDFKFDSEDRGAVTAISSASIGSQLIVAIGTSYGLVGYWNWSDNGALVELRQHRNRVNAVFVGILNGIAVVLSGGEDGALQVQALDQSYEHAVDLGVPITAVKLGAPADVVVGTSIGVLVLSFAAPDC